MGSKLQRIFSGKRLAKLLVVDDPRNIELTREYVRNGFRVLERESHEQDVEGNPKTFLNSMFGIVENGKLLRTWGIQRDITERLKAEEARHQAEEARRESEERYRVFVAQTSEGIYRTEHDPPVRVDATVEEQIALSLASGYIAECNDAMARMYGFDKAGDIIGKRLSEMLIADDPVTKEFMETFLRRGTGLRIGNRTSGMCRDEPRFSATRWWGSCTKGRVRTWGIQRDVGQGILLQKVGAKFLR